MSRKSSRTTVVSVRLDDTAVTAVDLLVDAGLAQSRSEAASQLIGLGVQASEQLLAKAKSLASHVRSLKQELSEAVKSNNMDKVQQLLAQDEALIDAAIDDGRTAVLLAAYHRAHEIQNLLLERGVSLNVHEAASVGQADRLKQLLAEQPELLHAYSFDGYTPLGLAAHFGHGDAAALLLSLGADVGQKSTDGNLNNTPLHAAIAGNHLPVVQLLLVHGAPIEAVCEGEWRRGYTPLHVAAYFNRTDIAQLLVTHGANVHARNENGQTAAQCAEARGHTELAAWLALQEQE